jgi:uncharacterized delta-60 repeat protein
MRLFSWLRDQINSGRRPCSARLRLEALEDRCLLSGGVLDPTFGTGGVVLAPPATNNLPFAVATYPQAGTANDGKIVVGGDDFVKGSPRLALARYNLDGSLDTTFGGTGEVFGQWGDVRAVAVLPNGKILAAGSSGRSTTTFAVAQYNADGSLDTTFGYRGLATTVITAKGLDEIWAMSVQTDGKIVVAGETRTNNQGTTQGQLALVRYNANGSLDTTFGTGGKALDHLPAWLENRTYNMGLAVDPGTGQIAVEMAHSESTGTYAMVVRYTSAGVLDKSFAGTGYETLDGTAGLPTIYTGSAVAIQPSNHEIIVPGLSSSYSQSLARLKTDGTLDGSVTVTNLAGGSIASVTFQANGGILVGSNSHSWVLMVTRYNPDLTLDTSFGAAGAATYSTKPNTDLFSGMALEPDGRIVVAGEYEGSSGVALVRFLAAGPQIASFTASPNPVPAGSSVTLTAANITDSNPGSTIAQVTFYYIDSSGANQLLGNGTQTSQGVWTLTFTVNLPPGSYTLFAQAEDTYGVFGDPATFFLSVQ